MSATEKNLWEAFAGESQANRKYLAFAEKAERDGYKQAARLFRAAAHAETIHAHAHLRALKAIADTAANLREAIAGESHEFKSMYPAMIEKAKEEGNKAAERTFTYANEVEKIHADLYQKALDNLANMREAEYHVCSVCGFTCEDSPPEKCPVCGANHRAFTRVD
jgi:rubrerythrin